MTNPKIKMKKAPKTYAFDLEKLSEKLGDAVYIFSIVGVTEEHENFEKLKPYLLGIQEPSKGLDYYQKELDEKFEELWARTKLKFDISKQTAEYHYNKKFEAINNNFEWAIKSGSFPQKLTITGNVGSYLVASNSSINFTKSSFVINHGSSHQGYYTIGDDGYYRFYMEKKPNIVFRWFVYKLMGFRWVDEVL